jgi:hypothetical protein
MRKRKGVILAVVGYIVLFLSMEGWGADWKLFFTTTHDYFYYDAESITHPSKDVVRVWGREVFTEKGVIEMVGVLGENFKTLSYWMDLVEFHCGDRKFRHLSSVAYSTDETLLHSFDDQEPKWYFISPESMLLNVLYNILCK